MKSRLTVAAMIAAAGAAGAILAAPIASAEPPLQPDCQQEGGNVISGTSTVCTSPGNAQITSSPGELGAEGWGMWPWGGGMWAL